MTHYGIFADDLLLVKNHIKKWDLKFERKPICGYMNFRWVILVVRTNITIRRKKNSRLMSICFFHLKSRDKQIFSLYNGLGINEFSVNEIFTCSFERKICFDVFLDQWNYQNEKFAMGSVCTEYLSDLHQSLCLWVTGFEATVLKFEKIIINFSTGILLF